MLLLRGFTLAAIVFCLTLSVPAQEKKFIVVNRASKDLKRTAARLHVRVEQLKNARLALQKATDLARGMDICPANQIYGIAQSWLQLDRSKASAVIESFIRDLRLEASDPYDIQHYRRVTSTAQMLIGIQAQKDHESAMSQIQNWPDPPAFFGDDAQNYRNSVETQVKRNIMLSMIHTDPEKALELYSAVEGSETQSPGETI